MTIKRTMRFKRRKCGIAETDCTLRMKIWERYLPKLHIFEIMGDINMCIGLHSSSKKIKWSQDV